MPPKRRKSTWELPYPFSKRSKSSPDPDVGGWAVQTMGWCDPVTKRVVCLTEDALDAVLDHLPRRRILRYALVCWSWWAAIRRKLVVRPMLLSLTTREFLQCWDDAVVPTLRRWPEVDALLIGAKHDEKTFKTLIGRRPSMPSDTAVERVLRLCASPSAAVEAFKGLISRKPQTPPDPAVKHVQLMGLGPTAVVETLRRFPDLESLCWKPCLFVLGLRGGHCQLRNLRMLFLENLYGFCTSEWPEMAALETLHLCQVCERVQIDFARIPNLRRLCINSTDLKTTFAPTNIDRLSRLEVFHVPQTLFADPLFSALCAADGRETALRSLALPLEILEFVAQDRERHGPLFRSVRDLSLHNVENQRALTDEQAIAFVENLGAWFPSLESLALRLVTTDFWHREGGGAGSAPVMRIPKTLRLLYVQCVIRGRHRERRLRFDAAETIQRLVVPEYVLSEFTALRLTCLTELCIFGSHNASLPDLPALRKLELLDFSGSLFLSALWGYSCLEDLTVSNANATCSEDGFAKTSKVFCDEDTMWLSSVKRLRLYCGSVCFKKLSQSFPCLEDLGVVAQVCRGESSERMPLRRMSVIAERFENRPWLEKTYQFAGLEQRSVPVRIVSFRADVVRSRAFPCAYCVTCLSWPDPCGQLALLAGM